MIETPSFLVTETTLVFAFRYALGRKTAAPSLIVKELDSHWPRLAGWTQHQIRREIARAIQRGDAGQDCDVATWRAVLDWETKEEPPRFEGRMTTP